MIVQDPFGLCWRTGYFTPDLAQIECDPDLVPKPAVVPPPPAVVPTPPKPPVSVVGEKITFAADAFFDFDKATLKPEAKVKLDDLASKLSAINLEVIIAVGHTDSIGSDAYNQKLSVRRADSVKAYLVSKGIEANRIYTEGKGKKQPIAPNTINGKDNPAGRAKNRRVEIEVVGTKKATS
jgi:OOP family OmpA-OmpF porin